MISLAVQEFDDKNRLSRQVPHSLITQGARSEFGSGVVLCRALGVPSVLRLTEWEALVGRKMNDRGPRSSELISM